MDAILDGWKDVEEVQASKIIESDWAKKVVER